MRRNCYIQRASKKSHMKRIHLLIAILIISCIGALALIKRLEASAVYNERAFFIEERIVLKGLPRDVNNLRIWIPYPVSDRWQKVSDFTLESPFDYRVIVDKTNGTRIIYLKQDQNILDENTAEIRISFNVKRKEYGLPFDGSTALTINPEHSRRVDLSRPEKNLSRFLKPDRLVPVNGRIKALAVEITQGKRTDLEKARAIYDYIIDKLTYSKDDPTVCGIGDSLLTLQYLKGICSDYHSLFISLARSLGIPAKFEIGFPIPADKEAGRINGYHCWAKFYLKNKGWIPVDISEADKHPEKRDYFFGHIDEHRIHLASGRDINLEYAKSSQPLNFFIYPYAELNGKQFNDIDTEIRFKNL